MILPTLCFSALKYELISLVYVTFIRTTPEKLWEALTNGDFSDKQPEEPARDGRAYSILRYLLTKRNRDWWRINEYPIPFSRRAIASCRESAGSGFHFQR